MCTPFVSHVHQAADVATGVSTVATSLSSAAVSLAKPFLRQASKQVRAYDEKQVMVMVMVMVDGGWWWFETNILQDARRAPANRFPRLP